MTISHPIRAIRSVNLLLLASLLITHAHPLTLGGIGRLAAFLLLASLLLFVVSRSADIASAAVIRSRLGFRFAIVHPRETIRKAIASHFNPAEPTQPFRFQRPPPPHAA